MDKKTVKLGKIEWIDIVDADHETTQELNKEFNFHELDLADCISQNQRSKIDEYDDYLFIVLHFPCLNKRKHEVSIVELDIFVGQNYLITLHDGKLKGLVDMQQLLSEKPEKRKDFMGKGSGYFLYKIVSELFNTGFPILDAIEDEVSVVERDVFDQEKQQQDMLKDIMRLKKNIITFHRAILPQRVVVAQLEHKNKKFLPKDLEVYFDDVVDTIEKIWNNLENIKALVQSLQDTNESIISHNTNNIIKILTIFSVILLPLTLISGIYGMNIVSLPYAQNPRSFEITLGLMGSIAIVMLGYFKYKRWI